MRTIKTIQEMQFYSKKMKEDKKSIGFVPTMGYFHDGHISLIKESKLKNDISVASIFVNPAQFGKNEDFDKYPRDLDRDLQIAMEAGADVLFIPSNEDMYPTGFSTYIEPGKIGEILCGASRPGHFRGVSTIVVKLLNIVKPHRAYFGQKDFQQCMIIKKIVKDLNLDIEIIVLPIIREKDGLAMSSRNIYLTAKERKSAVQINKSLENAKEIALSGEHDSEKVINSIKEILNTIPKSNIDYISIIDKNTLEEKKNIEGSTVIATAVYIGNTRLLDNIEVQIP